MKYLFIFISILFLSASSFGDDIDFDESNIVHFVPKDGGPEIIIDISLESYGQRIKEEEYWVGLGQDIEIKAKLSIVNEEPLTRYRYYLYVFSYDSNKKLFIYFQNNELEKNKPVKKSFKVKRKNEKFYMMVFKNKNEKLEALSKKEGEVISKEDIDLLDTLVKQSLDYKSRHRFVLRTE